MHWCGIWEKDRTTTLPQMVPGLIGGAGVAQFFWVYWICRASWVVQRCSILLKSLKMQKFIWIEILASMGLSCSRKIRVSLCALVALTLRVFVNFVCHELSLG
ncbi:hypothetical protein U1Q18_017020 [Sarracenia purpurea var. burkii]